MLTALLAAAMTTASPSDGLDVQFPPSLVPIIPTDLRKYFLVLLTYPAQPKDMSSELFKQHQAYLRQHIEAGQIKLVGPIDGSDHLRGMKIVSAASIEEAKALAEGDPAVREKVFGVEVYEVVLPSLKDVKIRYPAKP